MRESADRAFGDDVGDSINCSATANPSTKSKVDALVAAGCTKILFFPVVSH